MKKKTDQIQTPQHPKCPNTQHTEHHSISTGTNLQLCSPFLLSPSTTTPSPSTVITPSSFLITAHCLVSSVHSAVHLLLFVSVYSAQKTFFETGSTYKTVSSLTVVITYFPFSFSMMNFWEVSYSLVERVGQLGWEAEGVTVRALFVCLFSSTYTWFSWIIKFVIFQMQPNKDKFALNLQNAERILELMRKTHRQRIQEAHSSDEQDRAGKADHTFQSPQNTLLEENKTKHNRGQPRPMTVADKLQQGFLRKTYQEYASDLEIINENQQNVLLAIEKIVQRLNYLADSDDIIQKLTKKNNLLDEEIKEYEKENQELEEKLTKEGFSDMRMIEQTQKSIRNLVKNVGSEENDYYNGFANKWNRYLQELGEQPTVEDLGKLEKLTSEEVNKTISASMIADTEPTKPSAPPTLTKKKSEINAQLLGNLKEFSKNLKLPVKK